MAEREIRREAPYDIRFMFPLGTPPPPRERVTVGILRMAAGEVRNRVPFAFSALEEPKRASGGIAKH